MKIKWIAFLFLTMAAACVSAAVKAEYLELKADEATRKAYFAQPVRMWGDKIYRGAADKYHALLTLSNSKISYVFHLFGDIKDGAAKNVRIGMMRPTQFNWYAGGFINISSGKNQLYSGTFSIKEIKGGEDSGYVEMEFSDAVLNGTIRLELANNDDKLLLSFTPSVQLPYMVNLIAYPGAYGDAKLRVRKMITNLGSVEGNVKKLTPQDFWIVFGDAYYDREQNRGAGCCAFLFNPKEIQPGSMIRCGYACQAYLYCRQKGKPFSLILWDFKGWSVRQAVDYMKKLDIKFE